MNVEALREEGLTEELKELMLGFAERKENPFIRDSDGTFLRYDEIRLTFVDRAVILTFCWKGMDVFTRRYGWSQEAKTLSIMNLDGKMVFNLA